MKLFRRLNIGVLLLAAGLPGFAAQQKTALAKTYRDWLTGPPSYLITKQERQEFGQLSTDAARDEFIDGFWKLRAAPGGTGDSFREEFYRRVAYANAMYGNDAGSDGWRTDRGRAYILFGAPQTKSNFQINQELYPTELWFYQNPGLKELPPFFYLLFFDRDGIGGYRLYHPYGDGPDKITRSGQDKSQAYNYLKNINIELAHATLTYLPGEPVDTDTFTGSMESGQIVNALKGYSEMPSYVRAIAERRRSLERVITKIHYEVPISSLLTFVAWEKADAWVHYQLEINDPSQTKSAEGKGIFSITARLYSGERLILERSDIPSFSVSASQAESLKTRPFLFEDKIPVVPGTYRLSVSAVNQAAKRNYDTAADFTVVVPRSLSSGAILFTSNHSAEARELPFAFGGARFAPLQTARLEPAKGLSFVYQLTDNLLSSDPLPVEYVIGSVAGTFRKTFEDKIDPRQADAFGSIFVAKTIPLDGLAQGQYQLAVRVHDPHSAKVAAVAAPFAVVQSEEPSTPILVSQARSGTPQTRAVSEYERALCFLSQGRETDAARSLENSWSIYPNPQIQPLLAHLRDRSGIKNGTKDKSISQ